MTRRFLKRRTLVIAAITVALSIGIVFASVPYIPHPIPPHSSIRTPVSQKIGAGSPAYPSYSHLNLPALSNNETFAVRVTVTNGTAFFCAIQDYTFETWAFSGNPSASTFPSSSCVIQEQTAQDILFFLPPSSGSWDVAALNYDRTIITVVFSPV